MIAVNYSKVRNSLKDYCDKAIEGENVIITRKDNQNVILMSLDQYNDLQRQLRNAQYIEMINTSLSELNENKVIVKESDFVE